MKTIASRTLAAIGLMLAAVPALAAPAASPMTEAFLANVKPNVDFLDRSSRLAADRTRDAAVRSYARAETDDAVRTAELLKGIAPEAHAVALAQAEANPTALMTGRSVAIDGPSAGAGQSANGRQPLGSADLASLARLDGRKFDDAFWVAQVDALSQLRADYQAYLDDGDDSALLALAQRELGRVKDRLMALSKI